jgi:pimeloyl-ACP methyl ester carboxylesterase
LEDIRMSIQLPVGFKRFHKNRLLNYQMNRWYSWGWAELEDLCEVSPRIKDFESWKREFTALADKALKEGRVVNAAFYYRAADFFTFPGDPDKSSLYQKFSFLFYEAFKGKLERHAVPYRDTFLPAIRILPAGGSGIGLRGTIIVMGGFDSYVEEFYNVMRYLADEGYDVIGFEGPGQGAALKEYGLFLDIRWEEPLKAVLDYFSLRDAVLFGISMGGYWCIRAAAFEKRITRVIASSVVYDWLEAPNEFTRSLVNWMFKHPRLMSFSINMKMRFSLYNNWAANNWMYITGEKTPLDATKHIMEMNAENLHSDMVKQDVLILTGENDSFCPLKLHHKQVEALTNAKSVTSRIFTGAEGAGHHCQIGNVGLAMREITRWLDKTGE